MKIRDSGMPGRNMWETFFNAEDVLDKMEINNKLENVVEFGCGYGTFTIPVASVIDGIIYAIDIEPDMIRITEKEVKKSRLSNVKMVLRDFMAEGSGLLKESMDYAMLFNILHLENPVNLLFEVNRILKKDGKVGIIHWNYDPKTPRGPSMEIRPKPEHCIEWSEKAGFSMPKQLDLKPYHYGIIMTKTEEKIKC